MASESGYMIRALRCPDCYSFLSQKPMSPYGWYNPHYMCIYIYIHTIIYTYIYICHKSPWNTHNGYIPPFNPGRAFSPSSSETNFYGISMVPIFAAFFLESPSHHGCLIFPILVIVLSDYPINIPFISPEKIPGSWDFGQYIPFIFHSYPMKTTIYHY